MGLSPILFFVHTITIGTTLNFIITDTGLKIITCKQTLSDVKVSEIVEVVDGRFKRLLMLPNSLMYRKRLY